MNAVVVLATTVTSAPRSTGWVASMPASALSGGNLGVVSGGVLLEVAAVNHRAGYVEARVFRIARAKFVRRDDTAGAKALQFDRLPDDTFSL